MIATSVPGYPSVLTNADRWVIFVADSEMEKPDDNQQLENQRLLAALNAAYDGPLDPEELAGLEGIRRLQRKFFVGTSTDGETWTLDFLVAQANEDNLHGEVATGPVLGNEIGRGIGSHPGTATL